MGKIEWCLEKQAVKLISPDKIMSESFLERAEKDFLALKNQDNHWKIIFSYYTYYNSFIAVHLRYGIKSEIHSCTIEIMKLINEFKDYYEEINDLKEKRINVQYYLKAEEVDYEFIADFISLCKFHINKEINEKRIQELRNKFNPKS